MKATDLQRKENYLNENGNKSIYCSMVLRLMDTEEYSDNYCASLNLVMNLFPNISKESLETELDRYI
jgi:hypothetical protein